MLWYVCFLCVLESFVVLIETTKLLRVYCKFYATRKFAETKFISSKAFRIYPKTFLKVKMKIFRIFISSRNPRISTQQYSTTIYNNGRCISISPHSTVPCVVLAVLLVGNVSK